MFRKQTGPDGLNALADRQYEYSPQFLARERRVLFLRGPIFPYPVRNDSYGPTWIGDDVMAMSIDDPIRPIYVMIESPGGDIQTGFTLFDLIKSSAAPVITVCSSAMSMATVIAQAGTKRWMFPHSRIMLHLPKAQIVGDVVDLGLQTKLIRETQDEVMNVYVDRGATAGLKQGKTAQEIKKQMVKDLNRDKWFTANEALSYGLIDEIVTTVDFYGVTGGNGSQSL